MKRLFRKREAVDVEEALHTYGDMVYRLALVQMKNRSEAEDVFQEVFLRLVRYKDRIDGQEHLKAWLIRVTVNCCRKQFDSAYRRRTVPIDREIGSEQTYEMDLPGDLYMMRYWGCRMITGACSICFITNSIRCVRSLRYSSCRRQR